MSNAAAWKESRRESARAAIVAAAWEAVREEGLAGLSIRDLARRAGISTPTIYAYFESKQDVHDAMFKEAAEEFERWVSQPMSPKDPGDVLREMSLRFMEFCTSDVPRYQLLFQRTIPGFVPSPESYAPAVRALDLTRGHLRLAGLEGQRALDLWTAINTGLVDQQISNDPGGTRWSSLIDDAVAMFLAQPPRPTPKRRSRT
jgi:AcrR family transcriptional regulator